MRFPAAGGLAAHHHERHAHKANPGSADPEIAFFGRTSNLRTWRESGRRMFTKKGAPRWSRDTKVYGPKIYFSDALGKYVLFVNAIHRTKGRHCIGRAVAKGDELSPGQYGLIDQSIFQDPKNPQN